MVGWDICGAGACFVTDFAGDLDAMLAEFGQDVILRRAVGTTNPVNVDCPCRALVRNYTAEQLAGLVIQGDSSVVISATDINRAQWPGGQPVQSPPRATDPRVPRATDVVIVEGRARAVISASSTYVNGEFLRADLHVRG